MATRYVYGAPWKMTIATPTVAPTAGAVYTINTVAHVVVSYDSGTGTLVTNYNVPYQTTAPATGNASKVSGTGDSPINVTAVLARDTPVSDCHIGDVYYTTGDTLQPDTYLNIPVRLLIDAQTARDVTKINSAFLGALNWSGSSVELAITNTSTTKPLVVKMSGENAHSANAPGVTISTHGDWIQVGTGTGADNQTLSMTIDGVLIDNPPFLQVADGSGGWITYLNIGGNYKDGYSGSGLTPTTYPRYGTFAEVGGTRDLGAVFEFDEENNTVHFGGGGHGYPPPNGRAIRYPNIHITGTSRPNVSSGARNRWTSNAGTMHFENCVFSNRWCLDMRPTNIYWRNVAGIGTGNNVQEVVGTTDIDGLYCPIDLYGSNPPVGFWTMTGPFSLDNYNVVDKAAQRSSLIANIANPVKIGTLRGLMLSKSNAYCSPLGIDGIRGDPDSPINIGPFYGIGCCLQIQNCTNVRFKGIYFSDTATGVYSATNSGAMIVALGGTRNTIFETIRLADGGVWGNSVMLGTGESPTCVNVAFHDIVIDLQSHGAGIGAPYIQRCWVANATFTNQNGTGGPLSGSIMGGYPSRVSNYLSVGAALTITAGAGTQMDNVGPVTSSPLKDYFGVYSPALNVSPIHLVRTTGNTVGALVFRPAALNPTSGQVQVVFGVSGTDFLASGYFFVFTSTVDVIFEASHPFRGVSGMASAGAITKYIFNDTGLSYKIRMRNVGEEWGAFRTMNSITDVQAEFAALNTAPRVYDLNRGFYVQIEVISGSIASGRSIDAIVIPGITLDATFVAPHVGNIQVSFTNATNGAIVGILDNATPSTPFYLESVTAGAPGSGTFEFPYAFNGTAAQFKIVGRKAGYAESIVASSCYQAGKSVPLSLVAQLACTDADIDAAHLVIDGSAKTYAISAAHTHQELYQRAQWWAHQRANMVYDTPLTSLTGATFSLATGWTLSGVQYLSDAKTLAGGTITLNGPGTYTSAFSSTTIQAQGVGTYTFAAANSTITFTPAGTGTYNLGGASLSGSIALTNTTGHAITVQVPTGPTYTNNSPATITIATPVNTQGIDFTGLVTGSRVRVYTNGESGASITPLYDHVCTGATDAWNQEWSSDIVADYTIEKAGYLPVRVTGITCHYPAVAAPIQQVVDRSYAASSGLAFGSTATANAGTKRFTISAATTGQNWYSYMIECWIAQAALQNIPFPLSSNGPNSFSLGLDWEFSAGITYLSRDGLRYVNTAGTATAVWSAIVSSGVPTGAQVRYQQTDGGTTVDAAATGNIDQLVQVYGDASHGDVDYRNWLVLKVQLDGYDQAVADVYGTYGALEDQLYVVGLAPTPNGLTTGDPSVTGPTITDHAGSPVTWNSKVFSITVTDSATPHTGTEIMRYIRYALGQGGAFHSKDAFCWHDLVQTNGTKFKSVRGAIYGDAGTDAALKGVRVLTNGGLPHPDVNLFTADDGTTWAPPTYQSVTITGFTTGSRLQIYDYSTGREVELFNGTASAGETVVSGSTAVWTDSSAASVTRDIRLRVAYVVAPTGGSYTNGTGTGGTFTDCAKEFIDVNIGRCQTTEPSNALTYAVTQSNDPIYINNGMDGTSVTDCTITGSTLRVDINAGTTTWQHIYAFMCYWLTTEGGISDQSLEMTATDQTHYFFGTAGGTFKIKNISAGPLLVTGGNAGPDDGSSATTILDTSGNSIFCIEDIVVPFVTSDATLTVSTVQQGIDSRFSFNVPGQVDANIQYVNDVQVGGTGATGSEWGPA